MSEKSLAKVTNQWPPVETVVVEKSVKDFVYQAIVDLTNVYGMANREMVVQATGFKASLVDEAVKQLREVDLAINRHKNGQWTPVFKFDENPITATVLDNGQIKLEHGDEMMLLTPRAARMTVALLGGFALIHGR